MHSTPRHLSAAELVAENQQLRRALADTQALVLELQRQLDWFKRQIFGRKSEKLASVDPALQASLLAGLVEPAGPAAAVATETVSYPRQKLKDREGSVNNSGLRFDDTVPVQVIEVTAPELSGSEAAHFEVIGTRSTFRLAQRPGSYVVLEYRTPVLKDLREATLKTTPAPTNVLEKCVADASFLAGMLVDKFCFHLPLYRQHQRLAQAGITLSRTTLTSWVERAAQLLEPIYEAQLAHVVSGRVVTMDETPIKAGRTGPGQMRQGYYWPVMGEDDEVCFTYTGSRAASQVTQVLGKNFSGVLLSDGYAAYRKYADSVPTVTLAQCWSHARREFEGCQEADSQATQEALHLIAALYRQEAWIREKRLEGPDKLKARSERCEPVVKAFWRWCDTQRQRLDLIPSHPLSKALHYALSRREELEVFLADPDVPIDTNHVERALRPIALGRRNWLFCWTEVGARYVGIVQSLLATCRLHGVRPYTYLVDVLQRVGQHPARDVVDLTPRRWKDVFAHRPLRSDVELPDQGG